MQLHCDWFVSVWYKKVQILGTCKYEFFLPFSPFLTLTPSLFPFQSLALSPCFCACPQTLENPFSVRHTGERTVPQLLIMPSTRPPRGLSMCTQAGQLCTTVNLHPVQDKRGLACSLLVRVGFISSKMRQLCSVFFCFFFRSSNMTKTEMKHRQNQSRHVKKGVATTSSLWLRAKQMLAHVLWVSADITVSEWPNTLKMCDWLLHFLVFTLYAVNTEHWWDEGHKKSNLCAEEKPEMSPPSGINGSLCLCSQEIWKALCL